MVIFAGDDVPHVRSVEAGDHGFQSPGFGDSLVVEGQLAGEIAGRGDPDHIPQAGRLQIDIPHGRKDLFHQRGAQAQVVGDPHMERRQRHLQREAFQGKGVLQGGGGEVLQQAVGEGLAHELRLVVLLPPAAYAVAPHGAGEESGQVVTVLLHPAFPVAGVVAADEHVPAPQRGGMACIGAQHGPAAAGLLHRQPGELAVLEAFIADEAVLDILWQVEGTGGQGRRLQVLHGL